MSVIYEKGPDEFRAYRKKLRGPCVLALMCTSHARLKTQIILLDILLNELVLLSCSLTTKRDNLSTEKRRGNENIQFRA